MAFNSRAATIARIPANDRQAAADAQRRVMALNPDNGTRIDQGLTLALRELGNAAGARAILLLTDGQTQEEALARGVVEDCARREVTVHVVGTDDVDMALATHVANSTSGELVFLKQMSANGIARFFQSQAQAAASVAVQNVRVAIYLAPGVQMVSAAKSWPDAIPYSPAIPFSARPGDLAAGERLELYAELAVPAPPQDARLHVANAEAIFDLPQVGQSDLRLAVPVFVTFVAGVVTQANPAVLEALHRVKASREMEQASRAPTVEQAIELLSSAERHTRLAGDSRKTAAIAGMIDNARRTRNISDGDRKTFAAAGRRTKLVQQ